MTQTTPLPALGSAATDHRADAARLLDTLTQQRHLLETVEGFVRRLQQGESLERDPYAASTLSQLADLRRQHLAR
ncbi:MAG TPA: hypothetical protein VIL01_11450 [Thermomicrobiales bacterium]